MSRSGASGPVSGSLDLALSWAIVLGGIALALGLGYTAYGIFFAADAVFGGGLREFGVSAAGHQQIMANLRLAGQLMTYGAVVLVVAVLARYWMMYEAGLALAVGGAALFFGMPIVIDGAAGQYPGRAAVAAAGFLIGQFAALGGGLMAAGALQLLVHSIILLANRNKRRPRLSTDVGQDAFTDRKPTRQDQFLGPCWSLPFCRDSAKRVCPVLHSRKPCWRDGRGCYCDQGIVMMLSGDRGGRTPGRSAQGFVSLQSLTTSRPKTLREKRQQCLGCPIYLHRQGQKYRLFAPTMVAGVLALILLNKIWLDETYPRVVRSLGSMLSRFSFSDPSAGPSSVPDWAANLARQTSVEYILIFIGGVLLVSYLIHGLEWVLYKLGL